MTYLSNEIRYYDKWDVKINNQPYYIAKIACLFFSKNGWESKNMLKNIITTKNSFHKQYI